ncbi:MAG: ankyrin repeat domain-containing protein [Brachymonas sp.]|nr:ankyrin repeat domain-containing protein [Brachymonas sp.]NJS36858.1 ankyrin repeat domain-containing protein [Brachymonas sp.]
MSSGNWKEMYHAACDGNAELVELHIKLGVDVNSIHPEYFSTALVASIVERQTHVALLLLKLGAKPDQLSPLEGFTPIQAARHFGLTAVEERLVELGVSPLAAQESVTPQQFAF